MTTMLYNFIITVLWLLYFLINMLWLLYYDYYGMQWLQAELDKASLTATNAAQAKRIQELLAEIEMLKKRIAELESMEKAQDDTFKHRLADLQEVNEETLISCITSHTTPCYMPCHTT